jgi:hypothetical protein
VSWAQEPLPQVFLDVWAANNGPANPVSPPRTYRHRNGLTALVGREPLGPGPGEDLRWHISLRYGDPGVNGRVPSWEELVQAAHELRPGVAFVIGVPPRSWWINVHPHVLHLWEVRDDALVASWRAEQRGDRPT